MKNKYEIRGEVTAIFLDKRDGTTLETLIDTEDLSLVNQYPHKWYSFWNEITESYYVSGFINNNGKNSTTRLHRWIMNPGEGLFVDHINHDTLDNRKSNLQVVTNAVNQQNRKVKRSDNASSKYRGVSWNKRERKWKAYLKIDGKNIHLGYFTDEEQAGQAAFEARVSMMQNSQECELVKNDNSN